MGNFVYNDGGRADAGFKGSAGDCGTRAISIALDLPYKEVYDELNLIRKEFLSKARSLKTKKRFENSVRNGTPMDVMQEFFRRHGWTWIPTMTIGSGCQVHLRADELPDERIVCRVAKHFVAVLYGTIHDTWDSSGDGSRCVYGYWTEGLK